MATALSQAAVLFLVALGPAPASQPAGQPVLGRIVGRIAPPDYVRSILCLDRAMNRRYPARWDAATGQFSVGGLAVGRRYDLEVVTTDGKAYQGVDLSGEEDALLARRRPPDDVEDEEKPGPLTDADRGEIEQIVMKIETFEDRKTVLALVGDHSRATVLADLRRTRPFHSARGDEYIRRVEVWYFKFQHGGWERVANAGRVLLRVRAPAESIEAQARRELFVPQLGGIRVDGGGAAPPVAFDLPGYAAATQDTDRAEQRNDEEGFKSQSAK